VARHDRRIAVRLTFQREDSNQPELSTDSSGKHGDNGGLAIAIWAMDRGSRDQESRQANKL
jgi:hypothetical protein